VAENQHDVNAGTSFVFDPASEPAPQQNHRTLTEGEVTLLTHLGHLIMHWNKCEYFVRQILRTYVEDSVSIFDQRHVEISNMTAQTLEKKLKAVVPTLVEPGRSYIGHLAEAFGIAREHRNRFVHGLWDVVAMPDKATGVMMNAKPKDGMPPVPALITIADIAPVSNHVFDLVMFAQPVHVAFTPEGNRRFNADGTPTIDPLPVMPALLPPCAIEYYTGRPVSFPTP
jgi:hypothetical protein